MSLPLLFGQILSGQRYFLMPFVLYFVLYAIRTDAQCFSFWKFMASSVQKNKTTTLFGVVVLAVISCSIHPAATAADKHEGGYSARSHSEQSSQQAPYQ